VSKKLWGEDALEFNPDRWMGSGKNNGGTSSNFANMTFLHGPRSCIGASFAKAEFACLLASIVGRLKFKFSDPDYKPEVPSAGVTARLKHELLLTVEVVEGW
jgi:cytochrome P450